MYLEPGTYAMFCFVKSPEGQAHISLGMIRKLVVTDESTGASKPQADVELTIGVDEINQDEELSSGTNTISARFKEESEGYQTVHLIRMENDTDLEKVEQWLDWYQEGGLQAPAPAEFLGGTSVQNRMAPNGDVAYFTVKDLEPGQYAWVVRTFDYAFSKTFTIE